MANASHSQQRFLSYRYVVAVSDCKSTVCADPSSSGECDPEGLLRRSGGGDDHVGCHISSRAQLVRNLCHDLHAPLISQTDNP